MARCKYCGHEIPDHLLRCERCGRVVRIVPDYNPLDDVLKAQVKGSMDGSGSPLDEYEFETHSAQRRNTAYIDRDGVRKTTNAGHRTGQPSKKVQNRKAERRRAQRKRKRRMTLLIMLFFFILCGIGIFFLYKNSYAGLVNRGNKCSLEQNYTEAVSCYEKAIKKKPDKADAYTGLSKIYILEDRQDGAEALFDEAIESYPENVALYEAYIQYFLSIEEDQNIPILLEDAPERVRNKLKNYVVSVPEFSLDDKETFDDVQQLSLTSSEKNIYYTTDGSNPTMKNGEKYTEAIQISEGETVIKAISVNEDGIPSAVITKTYLVELPIESAPAISPSTGQYDTATTIQIKVPDGYTAYYTMDGSDPSASSTLYSGPIEMPVGVTIFKAILINGKGRESAITTRNYELVIQE